MIMILPILLVADEEDLSSSGVEKLSRVESVEGCRSTSLKDWILSQIDKTKDAQASMEDPSDLYTSYILIGRLAAFEDVFNNFQDLDNPRLIYQPPKKRCYDCKVCWTCRECKSCKKARKKSGDFSKCRE